MASKQTEVLEVAPNLIVEPSLTWHVIWGLLYKAQDYKIQIKCYKVQTQSSTSFSDTDCLQEVAN